PVRRVRSPSNFAPRVRNATAVTIRVDRAPNVGREGGARSTMWHTLRALLTTLALVGLPGATFAQSAPSMTVQRTPNYTVVLDAGPGDSHMMTEQMDQGMAANHHLEVRITHGDSDMLVTDVTPTIRVTDKDSGESRDLPHVMGMSESMMHGESDFHYGQD